VQEKGCSAVTFESQLPLLGLSAMIICCFWWKGSCPNLL